MASAEEPAPRLTVVETTRDFGVVEQGTTVEREFTFRNEGTADLRIEHVKGSCGCTVAVASATVIGPGGQGRIAVRLDTSGLAGRTTKVITVYTNDASVPVAGLTLTGEILADLLVSPSPLYLGKVRAGEQVRREIRVLPGRAGQAFTVTSVDASASEIHTRVEALEGEDGQRVVVEFRGDLPPGRFNDQVTLHTTSPRSPTVVIQVLGSIEGDLAATAPRVLARVR